MTIHLWLEKSDEDRLQGVEITLTNYPNSDGILEGWLDNAGLLAKIGKDFVLGEKKIFLPANMEFVRVKGNSNYDKRGFILTPYSETEVVHHLRTRTITKRTGIPRVELTGSDQEDFLSRVFRTYAEDPLVNKFKEKDYYLVVYSRNDRK